jgi:Fe-Mn family superoxide dismutase
MYQAKSFDHLKGSRDFSDPLMKNHFALYQGYVKNTNQQRTQPNVKLHQA